MIELIDSELDDDFLECFEVNRLEYYNKYITGNHVIINYMVWSVKRERMMQIRVIFSLLDNGSVVIDINHNQDFPYIDEDAQNAIKNMAEQARERIEKKWHHLPKWRVGIVTGAVQITIK